MIKPSDLMQFTKVPFVEDDHSRLSPIASEKDLRAQWRRSQGLSGWERWIIVDTTTNAPAAVITMGPYPMDNCTGFWVNWSIERTNPSDALLFFLNRITIEAAAQTSAKQLVMPVDFSEQVKCDFLQRNGFSVARRGILMKMELVANQQIETEPTKNFGSDGTVIRSLSELDISSISSSLYELELELDRDIPNMTNVPQQTLEEFIRHRLTGPDIDRECVFVAVDRSEKPVGICAARPRGDDLHIGMTGVRHSYRGNGLAIALKQHVIAAAKRKGFKTVTAKNDGDNRPILELNRRLGFHPAVDIVEFIKPVPKSVDQVTK